MNIDLVKTVDLSCINLDFWKINPEVLSGEGQYIRIEEGVHDTMIEDYGVELNSIGFPKQPDFAITGYFQETSVSKPQFYIDPCGPHVLYITGVPKGKSHISEDPDPYRLPDTFWLGYWEDSKLGYLFQITHIKN